jgi:hypothetical protein
MSLQSDLAAAKAALEADTQAVRDLEAKIAAALPHFNLWQRAEALLASAEDSVKAEFAAVKTEALGLLGMEAPATPAPVPATDTTAA